MHGGVLWCASLQHGVRGGIPLDAAHLVWMGAVLSFWGHPAQQSQVFDGVISRTRTERGASMGLPFGVHADLGHTRGDLHTYRSLAWIIVAEGRVAAP